MTRVVVTRPAQQAATLEDALPQHGLEPVVHPVLEIREVSGPEADEAQTIVHQALLDQIPTIVTSPSAAQILSTWTTSAVGSATNPIYSIGPATTQALAHTFVGNISTSPVATSAGLAAHILETAPDTKKFLLPTARKTGGELQRVLEEAGVALQSVVLYDTVPNEDLLPLNLAPEDWVTFASPSAVDAFVALHGTPQVRVACIGTITGTRAKEMGFEVQVIPPAPSADNLVQAIQAFSQPA